MPDSTIYSTAITPGAPPLRWDNVLAAFEQVNANFEILEAALGASGITPISFNDLDSNIIPSDTGLYVLGDITKQWKSVFTASWSEVPGNELNGLWAGNAQIKGIGYTVDLPLNSTVDGNLIIDPAKVWFNEIQIDNNESIVATDVNDSFNILSGNGISLSVDSGAESLTVSNTGILDVTAGAGISRTIVSGTANIVNTGVLTLANTGGIGTRTSGLGINVSSAAGNPVITNTGVISISSGIGITVSLDAVTGVVTVSNSAPAVNAFAQIEVDGDSVNRLLADSVSDVLNVVGGYGITLGKTVATDTLSIAVNPAHDIKGSVFGDDSSVIVNAIDRVVTAAGGFIGDLKGSVFGDDSTKIIDAVENKVYGGIFATTLRTEETKIALGASAGSITQGNNATAVGWLAGYNNQGTAAVAFGRESGEINQGQYAVAVGPGAGYTGQGADAIAIGYNAGATSQGASAVAIGSLAGQTSQSANSIVINASGVALNGAAAGFYVNPIRSTATATGPLMYNSSTKELFYNTVLEFAGSTISTNDSSGIVVDVQTTFNTDVTIENDLNVTQQLRVQGSRVINLAELKAIVAASADFAALKTAIAGLV